MLLLLLDEPVASRRALTPIAAKTTTLTAETSRLDELLDEPEPVVAQHRFDPVPDRERREAGRDRVQRDPPDGRLGQRVHGAVPEAEPLRSPEARRNTSHATRRCRTPYTTSPTRGNLVDPVALGSTTLASRATGSRPVAYAATVIAAVSRRGRSPQVATWVDTGKAVRPSIE